MNNFILVWFYEKGLLVKIQRLFIFCGEEVRKDLRTTIQ